MEEISKEKLHELLFAFSKENDRLFVENKKLRARLRKAIDYLDEHRFNKVKELREILEGDDYV